MRFKLNDFIKNLIPIWERELQIVRRHKAITPFFITGPSSGIYAAVVGLNPRTNDSCLSLHSKTKGLTTVKEIVGYRQIKRNYNSFKPSSKDIQMRHFLSYLKPGLRYANKGDNIFDSYKSLGACKINICSIPSNNFKWNPKSEKDHIREALQEWHNSGLEDISLETILESFIEDGSMYLLSFWMTPKRFKQKLDRLLLPKGYKCYGITSNCWQWVKKRKRIILGPNQGFPSKSFGI